VSSTPVVIVGAGPTGLMLACLLKSYDVPVRVLDRSSGPRPGGRATDIQAASLELFARMGVVEPFLERGLAVRGNSLYKPGGERVAVLRDNTLVEGAYPFVLHISQQDTEEILRSQFETLGGEIEWDTEVVGLEDEGDAVSLSLAGGTTLRTDWVAGCDGAHSTIRHFLGETFGGHAYSRPWSMAEITFSGQEIPIDEGAFFCLKECFALLAPMPGRRWRFFYNAAIPREQPVTADEVETLLHECLPEASLSDIFESGRFAVHDRKAAHFRTGRCLLLGDAAHIFSPAGGQGLNMGVQDAANLAWKLAMTHQHGAHSCLLDTYEVERRPAIETASDISDSSEQATANSIDEIVNNVAARTAFQTREAMLSAELLVSYQHSPIVVGAHRSGRHLAWAGPGPGHRFPESGPLYGHDQSTTSLHRLLSYTEHTALVFLGDARSDAIEAALELLQALPDSLATGHIIVASQSVDEKVLGDPDFWVHRRLGITEDTLLLVRPDGYLGLRSTDLSAAMLVGYFDGLLHSGHLAEGHFEST
jgi:2-polyprenyl-6-methoxyphenol hydroxylase-like FAD-dependent oxidoreductase